MTEREFILSRKKAFTILTCLSLVFFSCFTFPVLNLTYDFPGHIKFLNIVVSWSCYYFIGEILGFLFGHKAIGKILSVSLSLTLAGFVCRFFLEYGEVSNTYNFTFPNIVLHLLASQYTIFSAAFSTRKKL